MSVDIEDDIISIGVDDDASSCDERNDSVDITRRRIIIGANGDVSSSDVNGHDSVHHTMTHLHWRAMMMRLRVMKESCPLTSKMTHLHWRVMMMRLRVMRNRVR